MSNYARVGSRGKLRVGKNCADAGTAPAGPLYADGARRLGTHDEWGEAAAAVTVRSVGPGKPGPVEPTGVPESHRGRGYGRAITVAGSREEGSSSVRVCTPSSHIGGAATYKAAGFGARPEVRDRTRQA